MNYNSAPAISITVPVYNTFKYLRKCLDSLAAQTLYDIEFILVDDGSTDDSGAICDEYAAKDHRFKVIHQPNGGSASARQSGLDVALGEYIIVCDSDDWVEPDMYEKLYKKAQETDADIVCCGYFAEYNNGRSIKRGIFFDEENGFVDNFSIMNKFPGGSWCKLVKRQLFSKTETSYEIGINQGEDALIFYKLLRGNPKISQVKENLYHYRRLFGGESYTNNTMMKNIMQIRYIYNWLLINYSEPFYENFLFERAVNLAFVCLRAKDLDKVYLRNFLRQELTFDKFRNNKNNFKSLCVLFVKFMPISISKAILNVLYPIIYR